MVPSEDRRPSFRVAPFVLLLVGLLAAVAVAWVVVRSRTPAAKPNEPADGELLAPMRLRSDPATGEETTPFSGFALHVVTEPAGALVTVAGVAKGESPALAGVDCLADQEITVDVTKPGFAPARRITRCRNDTLVKLSIALAPEQR